jgi:alpha-amylase
MLEDTPDMPDICLYAQVHQPWRLRRYRVFDIGSSDEYFDDELNRRLVQRVAEKCYLPANRLLADLIRASNGRFRMALSLSGTLLDQLGEWAPAALRSFQDLVATGGVEILGETYHHSLASLGDEDEFAAQVRLHSRAVARAFGARPTTFRNTELIYWDELAPMIRRLGFSAVMVEGADHVMDRRSPNYVYEAATAPGLRLLPRNYRLSDDVGFRFSLREWDGWPVTADKYAEWVAGSPGETVNLYVDYETFGEHQWAETGIFDFLRHLPEACQARGIGFVQPAELATRVPRAVLSFARPTSWADVERDTSAWLGNRLQQAAHDRLYRLRPAVLAAVDPALLAQWRQLTTSDHVYYMCTKWFADGDVHKYFSPYESPYDAFVAFMNVLQDLEQRVAGQPADRPAVEDWVSLAGMACVA